MNIIAFLKHLFAIRNSNAYVNYLRSTGVKIGKDCIFRCPRTTKIDPSRPSLISIGDRVDMNNNFMIWTHDWCSHVFIGKYGKMLNSSGRVNIGSNIYFGANCIVLKGVSIGDNCIIGAGSVVSRDIPINSVAVGNPCRVICSIDDFFEKRKKKCLSEAVEYVNSIKERFGRDPLDEELKEEKIYYADNSHAKYFRSKEDFLRFCYNQFE